MTFRPAWVAAVALVVVGACWSDYDGWPLENGPVISLSSGSEADEGKAFPETEIRLAVGQAFTVIYRDGVRPHLWRRTDDGDGRVVDVGPEVVLGGCPSENVGCAEKIGEVMIAVGSGSTVLTWSYLDFTHCKPGVGAPGSGAGCSTITVKNVRVVVR